MLLRTRLLFLFFVFSLTVSFAFAQDDFLFEQDVELDNHDPGEYVPIRDTGYTEAQGNVADSFYGIIHYDIYERAYKIEDFFPLGYSAVVTYEYYPRLYETSRGWEPVVSVERGIFIRDQEQIASYIKTFDTSGSRVSYERSGFSVVMPIMQAIAAVLGKDINEDDIQ